MATRARGVSRPARSGKRSQSRLTIAATAIAGRRRTERARTGGRAAAGILEIRALYDANRYLDAHARAAELGPYAEWRDPAARIMAGRLLMQIGARALGTALHFYTYRKHPHDAEALYFYASSCKSRSPYMLLEFMRRSGRRATRARRPRATGRGWRPRHWRSCATSIARAPRSRAPSLPSRPLAAGRGSRRAGDRGSARGGARGHARGLAHACRLPAGGASLPPACSRSSTSSTPRSRCSRERRARAVRAFLLHLAHYRARPGLPRSDRQLRRAEAAAAAARARGRRASARAWPSSLIWLATPRWCASSRKRAATPEGERLANDVARDGQRVQVPIKFVRQHHMTCAPATLASIGAHWGREIDHAALAAEICYGGTSDHGEREWAERNGFATKEFRVTLESTRALIDRGIAFTLTTLEPTSGHLQAVFGYDSRRSSVLVRDPSLRHFVEYDGEILQHYRGCGPRGMALVPRERGRLLHELPLPESELYDGLFEMQRGLQTHQRDAAAAALARMEREHAGHRLTLEAHDRLARYDQDGVRRLRGADALLALFPDDARAAFYNSRRCATFEQRRDRRFPRALDEPRSRSCPRCGKPTPIICASTRASTSPSRTLLRTAIRLRAERRRQLSHPGRRVVERAPLRRRGRALSPGRVPARHQRALRDRVFPRRAASQGHRSTRSRSWIAACSAMARAPRRRRSRSSARARSWTGPISGFAALRARSSNVRTTASCCCSQPRRRRATAASIAPARLLARAEHSARAADRLAAAARIASYRARPPPRSSNGSASPSSSRSTSKLTARSRAGCRRRAGCLPRSSTCRPRRSAFRTTSAWRASSTTGRSAAAATAPRRALRTLIELMPG